MKNYLIRLLGGETKESLEKCKTQLLETQAELLVLMDEDGEEKKERPIIDINIGDPTPDKTSERKAYVATIAAFYHDYLSKKLNSLIAENRAELDKINRYTYGFSQMEYDQYLRGASNAFSLLHDWGESMINEHVANQEEGISEEETQELKDKLN